MRFPLWAQIGAALAVNLLLLGALTAILLLQQTKNGRESLLYAAARERIRELGSLVEQQFPGKADDERTGWLVKIQQPWHVTLAVYEDTGRLVAGPRLRLPDSVVREIEPDRNRPEPEPEPPHSPDSPPRGPGRRDGPPMFLIREDHPSRYWIGYHFPLVLVPGNPPVRHTLVVLAPSLLSITLFADWLPWLVGGFAAIVITVVCWIPLISRFTRSIHAVRSASAQIAESRFDVGIPVSGNDELSDLAQSIQRMSAQLSRLVNGQTRFLADVAHELCAPLSRIQLSTGILAERALPGAALCVERLERDAAHMSALVGDLLSFTKGSVRKPVLVPVALAELVSQVVTHENSRSCDIAMEIAPEIAVIADPEYLRRAVGNILRNAISYAGSAGPIGIRTERAGATVRLICEDCGPGLPESDLDAIFSPFYRPDAARTPGAGGSGLGLAIVKQSVEACEGFVFCRNRKRKGLEVVIELKVSLSI